MLKSFRYRLYPSKPQARLLERTLETCRRWYNQCLAERREAYQERGETIGKFQQLARVKELKASSPYATSIHTSKAEEAGRVVLLVDPGTRPRPAASAGTSFRSRR
jgi:transposase